MIGASGACALISRESNLADLIAARLDLQDTHRD
jgi:hypothetical protein